MYKIRFNLGKGPNYKKWKITNPDNSVVYLDPEYVRLYITNGYLKNRYNCSDKIFKGANKRVCAWIECEDLTLYPEDGGTYGEYSLIRYNPRVKPYWFDEEGTNLDGNTFNKLITKGKDVFKLCDN